LDLEEGWWWAENRVRHNREDVADSVGGKEGGIFDKSEIRDE